MVPWQLLRDAFPRWNKHVCIIASYLLFEISLILLFDSHDGHLAGEWVGQFDTFWNISSNPWFSSCSARPCPRTIDWRGANGICIMAMVWVLSLCLSLCLEPLADYPFCRLLHQSTNRRRHYSCLAFRHYPRTESYKWPSTNPSHHPREIRSDRILHFCTGHHSAPPGTRLWRKPISLE